MTIANTFPVDRAFPPLYSKYIVYFIWKDWRGEHDFLFVFDRISDLNPCLDNNDRDHHHANLHVFQMDGRFSV